MKELTLEITNKCSLKCLQCSTDAKDSGDIFFTLNEIEKYLEMYKDFDHVRLSGGEPFEHPDIVEIASLIKSKEKEVSILSCGVLENGIIKESTFKEIKPYVDEIIFSVHGDCDTHDHVVTADKNIYRHPAYWDGVIDSTDNARYAGVPISFHTVAMTSNYHSLEDIAKLVGSISGHEQKEIGWHVLRFIKQGRGAVNHDQALTDEQVEQLPDLLENLEHKVNSGYYPFVPQGAQVNFTCTTTFYLNKSKATCDCGSAKAVVTCYRKIIPCSALKYDPAKGKFPCRKKF